MDRARASPPIVSFISWSEDDGRAIEIAAALGGEARIFYDLGIVRRSLVPLRYALSATRTIAYLARRRPAAVIVTNPPIFPGLIAYAYARMTGTPVVLDSHPSAFGAAPLARRLAAVHEWLARRAVATLVTVDDLAAVIDGWGGRAEIVHEAPPTWSVQPMARPRGRPRVLYIGRFAGDEPTREVVEAARLVPDVDLHITGDLRKCPPGARDSAPPNVAFIGFLRGEDYRRALEEADIVLVLTRHEQAVNRAAYECVYAGRPLIVSRLPAMTAAFPYAVHVDNDATGIAEGIQMAVSRHPQMVEAVPAALALQLERWERQLEGLRRCLARFPAGPPLSAGLETAPETDLG
jgi:hypothetical protein